MTDLTVACVFVRGHVAFTVDYVVRLQSMVQRQLDRPHDFVCFTDRGAALPSEMNKIAVPTPQGVYAWWSKLQLFNPARKLTGRLLYLDLDVLPINKLDPIVDYPAPFALVPHAGDFNGKDGKKVVKNYNSSVMIMDAGKHPELYTNWTYGTARRLFGDQDWYGESLPNEVKMPLEWFPRISEVQDKLHNFPEAKVILCKRPKQHLAVHTIPWVRTVWQ